MRVPWLVVRNSPAESSMFGARSSRFRLSSPSPAPMGNATSCSAGFELVLDLVATFFLLWLIQPPYSFCMRPHLPCARLFGSCLLRLRGVFGSGNVHLFFRRWKHGRHSQSLNPQLARPSLRVVEMFVFFLFDLLVC